MKKRISDLPKLDRPREKLQQKGAEALSDIELIAIVLGSGIKGHDVMTVAKRILKVFEITKQLKSVGETLGIYLLDHIIFSHKGYYIFLENGEI